MNTALNNVVGLNTGSLYEDIMTFLKMHEKNSEETKVKYERSLRHFFMYFRNKELESLTMEDMKFRKTDVVRYQIYLQDEKEYSNSTVNSYMAAIASLYDFLESNEYNVKAKVMKVDTLPDESENYGELSLDEAEKMAETALNQRVKGYEKSMLIKLAYRTSFRKQSLLDLKWADIKYDGDSGTYLVTVVGKGKKKHTRPISERFYNEMVKIKDLEYYQKGNKEKVFTLSINTIQSMMEEIRKEMGFTDDKNICFHSLRNVAPNLIMERTRDIKEAQEQLNHTDINTTAKKYLSKKTNYATGVGVIIDEDYDDGVFEELTREQMLELLKGTNNGVKMGLIRDAKKMLNKE